MDRLEVGSLVDGTYRIEALLSESVRAHVYAVQHTRFLDMPLVLKIVPVERTSDFERDSQALASLTSPAFAAIVDRGALPDGRPFRIVRRFEGPSLREAMTKAAFDDDRASELMVGLAAAVFEAHQNGVGPLDLSIDNLMFEKGTGSQLGLVRALRPGAKMPDPEIDQAALMDLRRMLEKGRAKAMSKGWAPPMPPSSKPGAKIGPWRVIKSISESLAATVYDVIGDNNEPGVLKIAGPIADRDRFERELQLLTMVKSPHLVKVLSFGSHDRSPYYVMELLEGLTLDVRLRTGGPFPIPDALFVVEQMLSGAEDIALSGGGPADFSLEHCFATENPWRVKLTHASTLGEGRFKFYAGGRIDRAGMDPWSAAVALYELLTGRLPFPISRHSLAKAWMGLPMPLAARRRDVPEEISKLVNELISGEITMSRVALKEQLARLRLPSKKKKRAPDLVSTKVSEQSSPEVKPEPKREAVATTHHVKPMRANLPPPPPIDWRIEAHPKRAPIMNLTAAAFREDEVVVANAEAVGRLRAGRWSIDPIRDLGRAAVRRLVAVGERDYLAISSDRRLLRLHESGAFEPWGAPLARYAFYGIAPIEGKDSAYIVGGSTDWGRGIVARIDGERITIVAEDLEVKTLYAAAIMGDGSLIAVGARGSVARLRGGALIESAHPCESDLHVIGATEGDIVVAGAGAWAFRLTTAPLSAELEPVDTTSNLTCMAVDSIGNAWIGGERGRLMRRREKHWRRMNKPFPGDPAVLAIQAKPDQVRAVLSDGTIAVGAPVARPAAS
ncbi:MAG: serine/threonine-protein kinase [Labilithrix sp.]